MKHARYLAFFLLLITLFSGCDEDERPEVFEMNHFQQFDIPAGLNTVETHFFVFSPIPSQFADRLDALSLEAEEVSSVDGKFATFSTLFNDLDLDFIRDLSILVFDINDPDVRREIFYMDPVPFNTNATIRPFPSLSDVKSIVNNSVFGLEIRIRFRAVPTIQTTYRLEYTLSAKG